MHMVKSLPGQTVASVGSVQSEKRPDSAVQSYQSDTFSLFIHARDALIFLFTADFDVEGKSLIPFLILSLCFEVLCQQIDHLLMPHNLLLNDQQALLQDRGAMAFYRTGEIQAQWRFNMGSL